MMLRSRKKARYTPPAIHQRNLPRTRGNKRSYVPANGSSGLDIGNVGGSDAQESLSSLTGTPSVVTAASVPGTVATGAGAVISPTATEGGGNGREEPIELSSPILHPVENGDNPILFEWDDMDIENFLDDLAAQEQEQGIVPAGTGCVDTSRQYSRRATVIIRDFIDHLDSVQAYKELCICVENPFRTGVLDENIMSVLPKVIIDLSGEVTVFKIRLANRVMCSWQEEFKMKVPDKKSKCPYYQPASQNGLIRMFFSAMNKRYGWVIGLSELSHFPGCLTAMLFTLYGERRKKWVSSCVYLFYSIL